MVSHCHPQQASSLLPCNGNSNAKIAQMDLYMVQNNVHIYGKILKTICVTLLTNNYIFIFMDISSLNYLLYSLTSKKLLASMHLALSLIIGLLYFKFSNASGSSFLETAKLSSDNLPKANKAIMQFRMNIDMKSSMRYFYHFEVCIRPL